VKVGSHTRDSWVPRESGRPKGIFQVDQPRKASRTRNLDTIVKNLYADVISGEAVRPMDYGIH
jgi:hypothetical protein